MGATKSGKRVVPRDSEPFKRFVTYLVTAGTGHQPDSRGLQKWEAARRAASGSPVTPPEQSPDEAASEPEKITDGGRRGWIGVIEKFDECGDPPRTTDLAPSEVGATQLHTGFDSERPPDIYVARTANQVDQRVDVALEQHCVVVVAGPSKAGKTRTLFESARRTLPQARVVIPRRDALSEVAALPEFVSCQDEIIVWLDDLHEFLVGEFALTPTLLARLTARTARTVVAATIRHEALNRLLADTGELTRDQRQILAGAEMINMRPTSEDGAEQTAAAKLYPSLDLSRFGVAEILAGAPELLLRYEIACSIDPITRAVVQTVIDWARVGRPEPIPEAELLDLVRSMVERQWPHIDYTTGAGVDAVRKVSTPREGTGRITAVSTYRLADGERGYRPFDYLVAADDGQGRPIREIPHDLWDAMTRTAAPEIVASVGLQAHLRGQPRIAERLWHRGVEQGSILALYNLAVTRHAGGDTLEAEKLFRRSAERGFTPAMANIGVIRADDGDWAEAEIWYRLGAKDGDHAAIHNLALILRQTSRKEEALLWFARAAESGESGSMFNYGCALLDSDGSHSAAIPWLVRAANAGHDGAAFNLARTAHELNDLTVAAKWYRYALARTAESDAEIARRAARGLGAICADRGELDDAERWYRHAAERGDTEGMAGLGNVLTDRGAVAEGVEWLERGARGGGFAAIRFGDYLEASGDSAAADALLAPSADAGHPDFMRAYGGLLVDRGDLHGGLVYLRRGADLMHQPSISALVKALINVGDLDGAEHWLQQADAFKDPESLFRLANLAVRTDQLHKSEMWYRGAANLDHQGATHNLAVLLHNAGRHSESQEWQQRLHRPWPGFTSTGQS
ncbi:hypothetical protein ACFWBG_30460 [Nocardia salmonicida]|uniref:tetratricopeptide repeat protein n=1 Tax=Nocardia salmonicida TaxID=53431 RepID=UPI00367209D1